MHIQMLKAVSKMLKLDETQDKFEVILARIECAKTMLDGIIAGMDTEGVHLTINTPVEPVSINAVADTEIPKTPEVPVEAPKPERFTYLPVADGGKLDKIKMHDNKFNKDSEAPLTLGVKIDGKVTTYGKAKGNPFQNIELV